MSWAEDKSPEVPYLSGDLYFAYNITEEEINLANHTTTSLLTMSRLYYYLLK